MTLMKRGKVRANANAPVRTPGEVGLPGTLAFTQSTQSVLETDVSARWFVERLGGTTGNVSVWARVNTSASDATSADFSYTEQEVFWGSGFPTSVKPVSMTVTNRAGVQGPRSVVIELLSVSGSISEPSILGGSQRHTITINDSTASVSAENLPESANNYFVRQGGAGTQDGLSYANAFDITDFNSTGAYTFSPGDRVWFEEGMNVTGETVNNTTLKGTSSANRCIIGQFYRSGGVNYRGKSSADAPIIIVQGTSAPIGLHDGTNKLTSAQMFPNPTTGRYNGLFNWTGPDYGVNDYVQLENIKFRHSGGMGLHLQKRVGWKLENIWTSCTYDSGISLSDCSAINFDGIYITGDNFCQEHFGTAVRGAAFGGNRNNQFRLNNIQMWDGWGEGFNFFYHCQNFYMTNYKNLDHSDPAPYCDSREVDICQNFLLAKTSRVRYHKSGTFRGNGMTINNETYQYVGYGGSLSSSEIARDQAWWNGIIVGHGNGQQIWGDLPGSDHARCFWENILFIDNSTCVSQQSQVPLTSSRWRANAFFKYASGMGAYVGLTNLSARGASAVGNYFDGSAPGGGWTNAQNKTSGSQPTQTTGWRTLDDIISASAGSRSDGHFTFDEFTVIMNTIEQRARLVAGGTWESGSRNISERVLPAGASTLTMSVDLGLDYSGQPFTSTEYGPFRKI